MRWVRRWILACVSNTTAAAMEAESRRWWVQCPQCHHAVSVWDLGGLRWKASGSPQTRRVCPACGQRGWHRIQYRPDPG